MTVTATERSDQRVAGVTGGAGAIAARLAPDHTVVVLDRKGDVAVDLSEPEDMRRAAQLELERYTGCDVLVRCAGGFDFTSLAEFDLAAWRYGQAVNGGAALWLALERPREGHPGHSVSRVKLIVNACKARLN